MHCSPMTQYAPFQLSFAKNDVILVTQQLEGGWWEGSLSGQVGWFPSDFVGVVDRGKKIPSNTTGVTREHRQPEQPIVAEDPGFEQSRLAFRNEVLASYMQREKEHLAVIDRLYRVVIVDYVRGSGVLSDEEQAILESNLSAILDFSKHLLMAVEHQLQRPLGEQWIGKVFLDGAQEVYPLMEEYCERHCQAVELVQSRRSDLERVLAEKSVELKELLLGLSQVFRHIDKYAAVLQEVERNTGVGLGQLLGWDSIEELLINYSNDCRRPTPTGATFNVPASSTATSTSTVGSSGSRRPSSTS